MTYKDRLIALSRGFMAPRVFLTAIELDVFRAVAAGPGTTADIAARCGTSLRGAHLLLEALVALGLLRSEGAAFRNIPEVSNLCVPRPGADGSRFDHALRLWSEWSHLTEAVRSGRSVGPARAPIDPARFAEWLALGADGAPREIAEEFRCRPGSNVLDVGGGSGDYAIEIAATQPGVTAVVLDISASALALAEVNADRRGVDGRVRTRRADFLEDDLGCGFELAIMSSVCCLLNADQTLALLRRVHQALRPGGRVVVLDTMTDGADRAPVALTPALFALTMLLDGGCVHSHQQVAGWLSSAGFSDVRRRTRGGRTVLDGIRT